MLRRFVVSSSLVPIGPRENRVLARDGDGTKMKALR